MSIDQICEGIIIIQHTLQTIFVKQHTYTSKDDVLDKLCPEHRQLYDSLLKKGFHKGRPEFKYTTVLIRDKNKLEARQKPDFGTFMPPRSCLPNGDYRLTRIPEGCVMNLPFLGKQILAYRQLGHCSLYKAPPAKPEDTCPYAKPDKASTTLWLCTCKAEKK